MIVIDKGIALPPPRVRLGAPCKFPWTTMEVGDSFAVDRAPKMLYSAASRAGKVYSRKFVIRAEGAGLRCWRVA